MLNTYRNFDTFFKDFKREMFQQVELGSIEAIEQHDNFIKNVELLLRATWIVAYSSGLCDAMVTKFTNINRNVNRN